MSCRRNDVVRQCYVGRQLRAPTGKNARRCIAVLNLAQRQSILFGELFFGATVILAVDGNWAKQLFLSS